MKQHIDILDLLDIASESESDNLSDENIEVQNEMNNPIFYTDDWWDSEESILDLLPLPPLDSSPAVPNSITPYNTGTRTQHNPVSLAKERQQNLCQHSANKKVYCCLIPFVITFTYIPNPNTFFSYP